MVESTPDYSRNTIGTQPQEAGIPQNIVEQANERLADYFAVIGLGDDINPIEGAGECVRTIEKCEIMVMERQEVSEIKKQLHLSRSKKDKNINGVQVNQQEYEELLLKQEQLENNDISPYEIPSYNPDKEKWIDLDGTKNFYLRLFYGNNNPITDLNFYYIAQKHEHKLAVPVKDNLQLVPVKRFDNSTQDVKYHTVLQKGATEEKNAVVFHGVYDLKYYLDRQETSNLPKTGLSSASSTNKALCMAVKRQKKAADLPIYDVNIIQGEGSRKKTNYQVPEGIKIVTYRLGLKKDRLLTFMKLDLMKTKFKPDILDRYPPVDRPELPFTHYIASFCFPSGIALHRNYQTPQSFSFILTDNVGKRTYGTCLYFDEEPGRSLKRKLKRANVDRFEEVWTQKAICIMSSFSFMDSFKQVLNQLYRIHLSQNMHTPLERFILNVMDEVPLPDLGNNMVHLEIEETISFCRPMDQYPPYTSKVGVQNVFKALSVENVLEIFFQLLLEHKILLVSKHKSLLTQVAVALASFMFPLDWNHVLIPILPAHMIDVIDSPFPFLIGIQTHILNEALFNQSIEVSPAVTVIDLDTRELSTSEFTTQKSKMPAREHKVLREKLMRATTSVDYRPHPDLDHVDDAFFKVLVDIDEESHQIDDIEVRDAFLEFMCSIMHNYKRYIKDPGLNVDGTVPDHANSKDFFNFEKFRAEKDASKPHTFIYKLTQTTGFCNFIEARSLGKTENDEQIIYFDHISKQSRGKQRRYLIEPFKEKKVIRAEQPNESGLEDGKIYQYTVFPNKLDQSLYYKPRKIHYYTEDAKRSVHKQIVTNDIIQKMNEIEWSKYMAEVVYCMWFHTFAATLPMYQPHTPELVFFARKLLQYLLKKLQPMREVEIIYRRMFEACGSCQQQEQVKDLYKEMKTLKYLDSDKITYGTYYQSLLLCQRTEDKDPKSEIKSYMPMQDLEAIESRQKMEEEKDRTSQRNSNILPQQRRMSPMNRGFIRPISAQNKEYGLKDQHDDDFDELFDRQETFGDTANQVLGSAASSGEKQIKLSQVLENNLYIELCKECMQCEMPLREEEVLSCLQKDQSDYTIKCPHCSKCFVPKFTLYSEYKTAFINGREGLTMQLLPPVALYKEFINTLSKKGDAVLTQETFLNDHSVVFWNLILYFRIMKLPSFFLDQDYSAKHIRVQVSWIKKFLPSKIVNVNSSSGSGTSKQATRSSLGGSKTRLDAGNLQKMERQQAQSPIRNSSLTRLASGLMNKIKKSASKGPSSQTSGGGGANNPAANIQNTQESVTKESGSAYGVGSQNSAVKQAPITTANIMNLARIKGSGSVRSGSGPGSIAGSAVSDLERVERLMNQAKHANKSVVKLFGKHLEEFRSEMSYSKAYIQSDLLSQEVPDSMIRHAENVNMNSTTTVPFKAAVGQRMSLDNFSVNEPENRTSNLSNNRPPPNAPAISSQKYKMQTTGSQRVLVRRNSGAQQMQEDAKEQVEKSSSVLVQPEQPQSPSFEKNLPPKPLVSQLHSYVLQKQAQASEQSELDEQTNNEQGINQNINY